MSTIAVGDIPGHLRPLREVLAAIRARWPQPRIIGNTISIDTIRHGVLTAIRMPERRIIQSARYPAGVNAAL